MKTKITLNPVLEGHSWMESLGYRMLTLPKGIRARLRFARTAFTVASVVPKSQRPTMRSETAQHILRSGVRQLPMIGVVGLVLGLLVVGQAVSLLREVSAQRYIGTVMVTVVMRELGPLLTAFLIAARVGTTTVVELGALRLGPDRTQLPTLGIRTMREWVAPRLRGLSISVFCLTIYLIFVALASGYLVAFLQNVPLRFHEYCVQLAGAMHWMDFLLVALKAYLFGVVIAVVSCYHGIEQLTKMNEFPAATTRAAVESLGLCLALDAVFLVGYMVR